MSTLRLTALTGIVVLLAACAATRPGPVEPVQGCPQLPTGNYVQKVDSFLFVVDSSESMGEFHHGEQKLQTAKKIVGCINEMIPDFTLSAGLRSFGRGYGLFSINSTDPNYPPGGYCRAGYRSALSTITFPCGNTPLAEALTATADDLESMPGRIAVIVVSDGKSTTGDPVAAARQLKKTYEDRLCIYTVLIGQDLQGYHTMRDIAAAGACGTMVTAAWVTTDTGMIDFVREVFLEPAPMPAVAPLAPKPEPAPVVEKIVLSSIMFDFDKADIKPEFEPVLDEAAAILKRHPGKNIVIEGHTCWIGTERYNMGLSLRRAASVQKYLIKKGIPAGQLAVKGFGETRPRADNTTREGRRLNRRVEFVVEQ